MMFAVSPCAGTAKGPPSSAAVASTAAGHRTFARTFPQASFPTSIRGLYPILMI